MNTCKECGKGYCPSRVRKVFGHLPPGFCSPQCYTADKTLTYSKRKEKALELVEKMYEEDFISDAVMGDDEQVLRLVLLLQPHITPS